MQIFPIFHVQWKPLNILGQRETGAGATFDWMFFDNSKLIYFDI